MNTEEIKSSTPSFEEFNPRLIPFQYRFLKDQKHKYDYELGVHEVLFSGSVGSAKSLLLAHYIILHCLEFKGARAIICRRAMPQLRKTLWMKIKEHLHGCSLIKDVHYTLNETRLEIDFFNGSQIISHTWADGNYDKCRSYEASLVAIEELTENETMDFYKELRMRVGRLPHVPKNLIVAATNPGDPASPWYEYFIQSKLPTRHVYYSLTKDNPFLPDWYIEQLERDLDKKLARRMLYGEWVSITKEVVYYAYSQDHNYRDMDYDIDRSLPVHIAFDFNIGQGKPLSACLIQYKGEEAHVFDEVVVHGMRTADALDEMSARGMLVEGQKYYINGDAAGRHKDTRGVRTDYDIIEKYLANHKNELDYEIAVPRANPQLRERHNLVNSMCENVKGERRLFVYAKAKTVDKGLRLTQLKKGAKYLEDDSAKHPYQHITTALGYSLWWKKNFGERKRSRVIAM